MGSSWVIYPFLWATWQVTIPATVAVAFRLAEPQGPSTGSAGSARAGLLGDRQLLVNESCGALFVGESIQCEYLKSSKKIQKVLSRLEFMWHMWLNQCESSPKCGKFKRKIYEWIKNRSQANSHFEVPGLSKKRHITIDIPNSIEVSTLLSAVSVKCALPRRFIFGNSRWV
jgi:hypothetical protein